MRINSSDENKRLIEAAKQAMQHAYAPYSGFRVGAAVLADNKVVYSGCNIENASFGATNCAERTAIFKAISEGATVIFKIAIVSSSGEHTFPCGICRQVMTEFAAENMTIVLEGANGIEEYMLTELLPYTFNGTPYIANGGNGGNDRY